MTAVFLPMQRPSDYDYSQKVRSAMKTKSLILEEILSGEQLMGIISHMEFVIAMRLHALVYAVNVNVPVFGVEYNPKVGGFMRYAGIENYLPLDDFSLENSIEKIQCCMDANACISEEKLKSLKEKAYSNARLAAELLEDARKERAECLEE